MKHGSENETFVLEFCPPEIHQHSNLQASGFQLVQQLRFVSFVILRCDLDFNSDAAVNNQVGIVIANNDTFVLNLNSLFNLSGYAPPKQLHLQRALIDSL